MDDVVAPDRLEFEVLDRRGPQDRLLVLVHGYGESPDMLLDRVDQLDPDARCVVIAPHAPFEKKAKAIWHRALGGEFAGANEQYVVSHRLLHRLIDDCCDEYGLPRESVIVGGFSQGAGLAVGLLLAPLGRPRPSACLAFCGFAPPIDGLPVERDEPVGAPLLLTAADDDVFLPVEASRQSASLLAELGCDVLFRELPGTHTISDDAAEVAAHWMAAVLAGDVVSGGVPDLAENPLRDLLFERWGQPTATA